MHTIWSKRKQKLLPSECFFFLHIFSFIRRLFKHIKLNWKAKYHHLWQTSVQAPFHKDTRTFFQSSFLTSQAHILRKMRHNCVVLMFKMDDGKMGGVESGFGWDMESRVEICRLIWYRAFLQRFLFSGQLKDKNEKKNVSVDFCFSILFIFSLRVTF